MPDKPLNSGHAVEFLERVYALQQIIAAIIESHPMATHTPALRDAVGAVNDATADLQILAGGTLAAMEDAETETPCHRNGK
jgi:hypothetical protein